MKRINKKRKSSFMRHPTDIAMSQWKTKIFIIGGLFIIAGIFLSFFPKFSQNIRRDSVIKNQGEAKTMVGEDQQKIVEKKCEGEKYRNWEQGYEVCFPQGWYYKEFGGKHEIVGFDKRPIPEATEYGGRIMIVVFNGPKEQVEKEIREGLEDPEVRETEISGKKALEISGTINDTANFFSGQKERNVMVEKEAKTYRIFVRETADNYIYLLPIYNDFLTDFEFIEDYQTENVSLSGNIVVTEPLSGSIINSPLVVRGKARVWENRVTVQLLDGEGELLEQVNIEAKSTDIGLFGDFEASLNFFPEVAPDKGRVRVFNYSAKDGSEENVLEIAVGIR